MPQGLTGLARLGAVCASFALFWPALMVMAGMGDASLGEIRQDFEDELEEFGLWRRGCRRLKV